jgi:hypothetical protein
MAQFIALFHSEAFLGSRLSSPSPAQDLKYLRLMQRYREEDKEVAEAAINSIFNHLWYLTQEVVILSLFNAELPTNLRQDTAKQLLSFPRPKTFVTGKTKFPINELNKE